MDWNTHFTQMMGGATAFMYCTHFLNATEALQRVLLGVPPNARCARCPLQPAQQP